MVSEQAVREGVRERCNVLDVEVQKMRIIAFFDENILAVGPAIVNVIEAVIEQGRWTRHGRNPIIHPCAESHENRRS